jgi:tellurite resistance protein TerC
MLTQNVGEPWQWAAFIGFVLVMVALDLGVFHRKAHQVSVKEAAIWTGVWVALAGCFNLLVYLYWGVDKAAEFATGYVLEKALAVDNIFVFILIFGTFSIPLVHQHRVLLWGILGALAMRALFIGLGAAILSHFHWTLYIFGAFLAFTGIKLLVSGVEEVEEKEAPIITKLKRIIPMASGTIDGRFFVEQGGKWLATPLFVSLVAIEVSDIVFAVDSIPAIFAVTQDPFIVFTSNIFAILGLRSMYFLLAGVVDRFVYLKTGLAAVLLFVGAKMLLMDVYKLPVLLSLGIIIAILSISVIASWIRTRKSQSEQVPPPEPPLRVSTDPSVERRR